MFNFLFCDEPQSYAMFFQDPASNFFYGIIDLHDHIVFYLILITTLVFWIFISTFYNKDHLPYLAHGNLLELIWTLTPATILWLIAIPSLKLLYLMDEILDAELTIKAIGFQWAWIYEYSDYINDSNDESIVLESYLVPESDLELGEPRQLAVDNYLVLPINTSIRILITSNDVIHSFAVPSLGVKCDAVPGRQNAVGVVINRPGYYYGQCSELCGDLHSAMPIGIKAVNLPSYFNFIKEALSN